MPCADSCRGVEQLKTVHSSIGTIYNLSLHILQPMYYFCSTAASVLKRLEPASESMEGLNYWRHADRMQRHLDRDLDHSLRL